jgi:hypothetical protein
VITATEYRVWAEESLEWARNAANESARQAYIRWAEIWLESALRVERLAALSAFLKSRYRQPNTTGNYLLFQIGRGIAIVEMRIKRQR